MDAIEQLWAFTPCVPQIVLFKQMMIISLLILMSWQVGEPDEMNCSSLAWWTLRARPVLKPNVSQSMHAGRHRQVRWVVRGNWPDDSDLRSIVKKPCLIVLTCGH